MQNVTALKFVEGVEVDDDGKYSAQLESRATFTQVVELVRKGLSYIQVSEVVGRYIAASTYRSVSRVLAGNYMRLITASGSTALAQRCGLLGVMLLLQMRRRRFTAHVIFLFAPVLS
eukprot:Plantae.Rhodophyta-Palmaria_palmata.ctg8713.p2 GENE.Plantae.Rhodophyta-Palmaria_palmata.ctg8713~~Plantae.Rhodophyta-Palmaria_palmata.ctg8713.p2  ORF type:complete len:117 (+),score=13.42 Plantae.Rhodophyta-Palmaria_palmata.ctg8713:363-713(+)